MGIGATRQFAQAIRGLMTRRDDRTAFVNQQTRQCVMDANRVQVLRLIEHCIRLNQHESRKKRARAGHECRAAELREGVMKAVGGDDVMARLGAAIEAHDQWRFAAPREEIDDRSFSAIAEGEIDDEDRVLIRRHSGD